MSLSLDLFTPPVIEALQACAAHPIPLTRSEMKGVGDPSSLRAVPGSELFPGARHPDAALSGLLLRMSAWEDCHRISQDIPTMEGNYWHAIVHRIEPDSWNSKYWFERVGRHGIFPELRQWAAQIVERCQYAGPSLPAVWDPSWFIQLCEDARKEQGRAPLNMVLEIQMAEWELLFEWCASA